MEWSQKKETKNTQIKIMPKKLKEAVKKEDKIVTIPDKDTTKKKVSVELEVDIRKRFRPTLCHHPI